MCETHGLLACFYHTICLCFITGTYKWIGAASNLADVSFQTRDIRITMLHVPGEELVGNVTVTSLFQSAIHQSLRGDASSASLLQVQLLANILFPAGQLSPESSRSCIVGSRLLSQLHEFHSIDALEAAVHAAKLFQLLALHEDCSISLSTSSAATPARSQASPVVGRSCHEVALLEMESILAHLGQMQIHQTISTHASGSPITRRIIMGTLLQCWAKMGQEAFADLSPLQAVADKVLHLLFDLHWNAIRSKVE